MIERSTPEISSTHGEICLVLHAHMVPSVGRRLLVWIEPCLDHPLDCGLAFIRRCDRSCNDPSPEESRCDPPLQSRVTVAGGAGSGNVLEGGVDRCSETASSSATSDKHAGDEYLGRQGALVEESTRPPQAASCYCWHVARTANFAFVHLS